MHSKADSDDLRKSMLSRSFLFKQNTYEWDIRLGNSIVWYLSKLCALLKFTKGKTISSFYELGIDHIRIKWNTFGQFLFNIQCNSKKYF